MWVCFGRWGIAAAFVLAALNGLMAQTGSALLSTVDAENLIEEAGGGDTNAEYPLGLGYASQEVGTRDNAEAVKWFERAAIRGDARAFRKLGFLYLKRQNSVEAVRCFREAAEAGDATAQLVIGALYVLGREVPRDYLEAIRWFERAAEHGISTAAYNLGVICDEAQNQAEAAKYLRVAADQGLPIAQFRLGFLYAEGRVFLQDYVQAYKWMSLAASRATGEHKEKYSLGQRLLSSVMAPNQITRAQGLASQWIPKTREDPTGASSCNSR